MVQIFFSAFALPSFSQCLGCWMWSLVLAVQKWVLLLHTAYLQHCHKLNKWVAWIVMVLWRPSEPKTSVMIPPSKWASCTFRSITQRTWCAVDATLAWILRHRHHLGCLMSIGTQLRNRLNTWSLVIEATGPNAFPLLMLPIRLPCILHALPKVVFSMITLAAWRVPLPKEEGLC
jgi:hypothetical protein